MNTSTSSYTINKDDTNEQDELANMLYGDQSIPQIENDIKIEDVHDVELVDELAGKPLVGNDKPKPNPAPGTIDRNNEAELKEGTLDEHGESSLADDWEDYKWLEPDQKVAKEAGRLSVFGGTDLSLCTNVDDLATMGIGIQMYFKLLQHLALTMLVLTLFSAPITATFFYGNRFRYRPYFIDPMYSVYLMAANIGDDASTAQACVADTLDGTGMCETALRDETVTFAGYFEDFALQRFSSWAAMFDAGYIVVYVVSVLWFRRSIRVMEAEVDKHRTTITDYTIVVKGFPRNASKRDVMQFFSDRFNPNDDRGRVYDTPEERIVDEKLFGHEIDTQNDAENELNGKTEQDYQEKLQRQRKLTKLEAIAEGLYVHDAEEEERVKNEKSALFYKEWKRNDEDHKRRAAIFEKMQTLDKVHVGRKLYPVKNAANTGEDYLYQGTWVAEVTMAYDEDGACIRRYMTKQKIVRAIQKNKALVQMYSLGSDLKDLDPDGLLKQKCSDKVKELEEKLGKLGNKKFEAMIGDPDHPKGHVKKETDGPDRRAVMAFVVFKHETSYLRAVEAYSTSWSFFLRRCQARRLKFPVPDYNKDGTRNESSKFVSVHVSRAPDPSDLYWENLDTTNCNRRVRVAFTALITLSILVISFSISIIVYGSIGEISKLLGNTGDSCVSIKADVVRHAQQYNLSNTTFTNTNTSLFSNASSFPYTYLELNNKIKPKRTTPIGGCPTNWFSLQYVYAETDKPVLPNGWNDQTKGSSTCDSVSMCPVGRNTTRFFTPSNCQCIPNELAKVDEEQKHQCSPFACTKSASIVLTADIMQPNSTIESVAASETCAKYGPAEVRTCYCVETMNAIFEQMGTSLGMAKFIAQDGDICLGTALLHYGARQLSFAAVFLVVGINVVLQKLVAFLARFERHPTKTEFLSAQMMKTFIVLFINTGFVVLIANSNFGKVSLTGNNDASNDVNSADSQNVDNTGFSSFSTLWYSQVGVSITLTMCLDMFTPHIPQLFTAFVLQPVKQKCLRNRRQCKGMRNKSATQNDVNEVYDGLNFVLPVRLATIMNTLAMTISYSGGLPALLPLACISFTISFNIDRMMLLRYYKRPPEYTTTLVLNYFRIVPIVVLIHLGFSAWMYSDPTVMWSERLDTSSYRNIGTFYTFAINYMQNTLKEIGFFSGAASGFIDTMASRVLRLGAVPQILTFVFIVGMYFLNFTIQEAFVSMAINIRVCFGQLNWCNRLCKNKLCRFCCENGDAGFEENPPYTEHYRKNCRDNTGRLIHDLELAEARYITTEEQTKGFIIEYEEARKITYKTKVWGKSGEASGRRYEGRTQMFTYEVLLYFQGSPYSYSIHDIVEYETIMQAQIVSRIVVEKVARRHTLLVEAKEKQKALRMQMKQKQKSLRMQMKKKQKSMRMQLRDDAKETKHEKKRLAKEIKMARATANKADEDGDEAGETIARDLIKKLKMELNMLEEGKEGSQKKEHDDAINDNDEETLSRTNILTWTAPNSMGTNNYERRTWKLRNKIHIMKGGLQNVVQMTASMQNIKDGNDGNEMPETKEEMEEMDQMIAEFEMKEEEPPKKDLSSDTDDDLEIIEIGSSSDEEEVTELPLPRWAKLYDSTHVSYYYLDNYSGESSWEIPEDYISPRRDQSYSIMNILNPEVKAALMVQKIFRCKQARKVLNEARKHDLSTKEEDFMIGDWAVLTNEDGHEYYVHRDTGEASWNLPATGLDSFGAGFSSYEIQPEKVTKPKPQVVFEHKRKSSKYAVVNADGSINMPTFPGGNKEGNNGGRRRASINHAPSHIPRPSRRKSVKRPDGSWIELPG